MEVVSSSSAPPPASPEATGCSPSPAVVSGDEEARKVYLAVGKDVRAGKSLLLWALQKFPQGAAFVVVHIYSPPKFVPIMGSRFPVTQLKEQEVNAYRKMEMQGINDSLDQYLLLCAQEKVKAEKLVAESDDVAQGIVELISSHRVTALVMGAAADKYYTKKMKIPRSRKARIVEQQADPFCNIWFICKGTLIYHRPALLPLGHGEMQADRQGSGSRLSPEQRSISASEMWCVSNTWLHKPMLAMQIERTSSDPSCYDGKEDVKENDEMMHEKLQHILKEMESLKQNAYEESCRRQKAERDLVEALQKITAVGFRSNGCDQKRALKLKAETSGNLYLTELKQKNEIEEKLTIVMMEVEKLTRQTDGIAAKLQEECAQKLALERRNAHSDRIIKDLMLQRDKALREAEVLRMKKGEPTANAQGSMHITDFSYSEIKEATDNFDQSLKIGEGVYGSVYKGFLRNTTVAIKKLNPESTQSISQFNQEVVFWVEVLSRVRHPNLVNLIGACNEARALVYEFMPNGSVDDRLACKDNSKPLSWQLRTRIASEICSALIFLHSNKPHSIVHSDLKLSNILLDGNNVTKLSGFGVCRMSSDEFKTTTTLYRHTHPKGAFVYIDPEYLISGDLTPLSDVYSFGIVLLRLLTGRSGFGLLKDVQRAVERGSLPAILDRSAGDWPSLQAEQLACIGLRCCEIRRKNRPDLKTEVWTVLEPMSKSATVKLSSLSFKSVSEDLSGVPSYFICPILQDIMRDPLIAADGFTYEAEAIKEWFDSGHRTSPMTNLELPHRDLMPNHALRSAIQEWLQTQSD